MKNTKNKLGLGLSLLGGVILLSGCTASFCSTQDEAEILYPYDQGITIYCLQDDVPAEFRDDAHFYGQALNGNTLIYKYIPYTIDSTTGFKTYSANKASYLNTILSNANSNGYGYPSIEYLAKLDQFTLEACVTLASGNSYVDKTSFNNVNSTFISSITLNDVSENKWCINPYVEVDPTASEGTQIELTFGEGKGNSILRQYGAVKFSGVNGKSYGFMDSLIEEVKKDSTLGIDYAPTNDYYSYYKSQMSSKVSNLRSCIATSKNGTYGHYGLNNDWKVQITQKSWSYAWDKGFLEGLLVYPVSWLVDNISYALDPSLAGWGQLLALIIVTVIVRGVMLLATFKNTMSQQKMTELQPQLAKIQAKYPNANTNQAEKQRLAQEQMMLYKRNKINPMSSLIVLVFQFPIFICVWSALQGSAVLSTGSFLNLSLSDTIKDTIFNGSGWAGNIGGNWTALVLFILMAGAQVVSMLLPQWFAKKKTKDIAKLTANPAAKEQGNKTKTFMYVMMAMTIFMGFMLPSAMGVYWLIGAIISMIQTLITQLVLNRKK